MNKYIILIFTVFLTLFSVAQMGTIRGFVYDEKTGEPVIFTNVILKGTSLGVPTDVNGYYSITKIPPGSYVLTVSNLTYDNYELPVEVEENKILSKQIFLLEGSKKLREFTVSSDNQEKKTDVTMSVTKATSDDIKGIPSIGGDADIATYFQTVPGVVSTGDQGGQMYVRGGSPIQNKVLLDGMVIYNPFHSIGFFSVFETEIIRNADIYTGGFNAEYGGRISSIMDITTRDGKSNRFAGKVSASPFTAKLVLEGPLRKPKKPGDGSITYVLTGKRSYLAESSKLFYSYIDTAGLPFNYTDLYGKISFNGKNGSKFNLFGFNFTDQVKYQAVSDLKWNSYGVGSNFIMVPGSSPVLIEGKFSFSDYKISLLEENLQERTSSVGGFNLGFDFKYFIKDSELKYGIEVSGFSTDYTSFNSVGRKLQQKENTTELSAYMTYKIVAGLFVIEPSFRLQYYATLKNTSPEPRLGIKYNVNENLRLKLAGGVYSQNLISANSDRDVVNLFYGFLSGPDNLQDEITDEDGNVTERKHSLQKANHAILGAEYDISKRVSINVEGYLKRFTQLTNTNRNKVFNDDPDIDAPDIFKKDFIIEIGNSYGVDFVLKYTTNKLYLWGVYSLGKVTRWDGIRTYSPIFDRRHSVNLVGSYKFGENNSWEVNARWNYGSGLPFTQTQGYYHKLDFSGGTGTNVGQENSDELAIAYASLGGGRLPSYHRLDISIKKTITLGENSILEINLGATNMYNRDNIFYVDRVTTEKVYQLPLLPSLGASLTF
jgi:hypothetical protein